MICTGNNHDGSPMLKPPMKDHTGCTNVGVSAPLNQLPRPTPGARVNKGRMQGGAFVGDKTNFQRPPRGDWESIPQHMPTPTKDGVH